ncbi:MAG: hypothetical protein BMS9Abin26_0963 [Gammaproteobacteria bacterium]|nr:MAG: hypothetical protein BMS9Abin26_0963 [Gammaproteobacteria bacterium]
MNAGLLIITHKHQGRMLVETATTLLGVCPLAVETVSVPDECEPGELVKAADEKRQAVDSGDGVLVLTDMYGATPGNIANALKDKGIVSVVSGVNLPMLIRILNYPNLSLRELSKKAVSGGRDGVMLCNQSTPD